MNLLFLPLAAILALIALVLFAYHRRRRALNVSLGLPLVLMVTTVSVSVLVYAQLGRFADWQEQVADDRTGYLVDKAINQGYDAIEATPGNPNLYLTLADNLASKGRYGEAVEVMENLISILGDAPEYLGRQATYLYYRDGRFLDGEAALVTSRALAQNPSEYHTRLLLATDAYLKADYALAIEHWGKILERPAAGVDVQPIRNAMRRAELKLAEQDGQS